MKGTPQATPELGLCMRAVGSVLSGSGGRGPFTCRGLVWVREIDHSFEGCGTQRSAEGPESSQSRNTSKRFEFLIIKKRRKTVVSE